MARPKNRHQAAERFRPAIAAWSELPRSLVGASPTTIWQAGEEAENSYDYELADRLYGECVRTCAPREVLDYTQAYTAFLVNRYGQFAQVAAWLDDDRFAPTADPGLLRNARELATDLARAAHEAAALDG